MLKLGFLVTLTPTRSLFFFRKRISLEKYISVESCQSTMVVQNSSQHKVVTSRVQDYKSVWENSSFVSNVV